MGTNSIWLLAAMVLLLNVPFGFWRGGAARFSLTWFLAIHLPVPLVAGLRIWSGHGWRWTTFPLLLGAYFAGQLLGARIRKTRCDDPGS